MRKQSKIDTDETPPKNALLKEKIEWCVEKIVELEYRQVRQPKKKAEGHWIILLCLLFGAAALYLVYVFYASEMGFEIRMPEWMKR